MTSRPREIIAPLAVITPIFALGVVMAKWVELSLWWWVVAVSVCMLIGVCLPKIRMVAVLVGVAALGGANLALRQLDKPIPYDQTISATMEIASAAEPASWGGLHADARIISWRDSSAITSRSNRLAKVTFASDTIPPIGTRIKCRTKIRPIAPSRYADLMHSRGFVGYATLSEYQPTGINHTLRSRATEIQQAAIRRLEQLRLPPDDRAVAEAMVLGYRRSLSQELRQEYADTGASHLLAVSGLHVGIVFVLVNVLLLLLPALPYGHIIKNVIAVAMIWAFAFISGMSPSAVRAATMFSFVQAGLAMSLAHSPLNTICGAGLLMLVAWPEYLFDISFQLSFAAVLGITLWFPVAYDRVRSESRVLNFVWSAVLAGICATVAVMPLTGYAFGQVSLPGVVLSPVVVGLAHITLICGLVWCIAPWEWWQGAAEAIISTSVGLQNDIVGATARLPLCAVEWNPSATTVTTIYIAMIVATIALRYYVKPQTETITFE